VERAAAQAELARLQAIEAKEAAVRAKDLQRRIAANLPPTVAEVETLLIAVSAKRTEVEMRTTVEILSRNRYLTYGQFFGNQSKTNDFSLSISDLACRTTGATHTCTWKEATNWVRFFLFESVERQQGRELEQGGGVFRWTPTGLAVAGDIDVTHLGKVRTGGSSGSSSSSSSAGRSLQDQFMDRELDNRQNYLDRSQGMGSKPSSYDPAKRY